MGWNDRVDDSEIGNLPSEAWATSPTWTARSAQTIHR